jgi:hypothetical protein
MRKTYVAQASHHVTEASLYTVMSLRRKEAISTSCVLKRDRINSQTQQTRSHYFRKPIKHAIALHTKPYYLGYAIAFHNKLDKCDRLNYQTPINAIA